MAKLTLKQKAMEHQKIGRIATIVLKKPYVLSSPDTETEVNGETICEFGTSMYCRTGTVLKFDLGFWLMPEYFIQGHLHEIVEVTYDIPGKKSHSIHTKGVFTASVHCISNLAYHANIS
jgi:hypothetical protein